MSNYKFLPKEEFEKLAKSIEPGAGVLQILPAPENMPTDNDPVIFKLTDYKNGMFRFERVTARNGL